MQWAGNELVEEAQIVLERSEGEAFDELRKRVAALERLMKRGEELDKDKYKMIISEYRKFKAKKVKHFRFNPAANFSMFGS